MRIEGAFDAPPIDPLEQHRQLRARQTHRSAGRLWPYEAPALESLREQAQSVTAPPQDLDPVAAATAEHEQLARERILSELHLHEAGQPVKAFAQIRRTRGQPD